MKTSVSKISVEAIGNLTWHVLSATFQIPLRSKLPPIYFFLAPWSRGSLKGRTQAEINLVHRQQQFGEGVTLIDRPSAWVSRLSQIPEEASHLFALIHQPVANRRAEKSEELTWMTLHEAFGKFGEVVVKGQSYFEKEKPIRGAGAKNTWVKAHMDGYHFGRRMALNYFKEKISSDELQDWFLHDWSNLAESKKAFKLLKFLSR